MLCIRMSQHVSWVDFEFQNGSEELLSVFKGQWVFLIAFKHATSNQAQLRVPLACALLASASACCGYEDSY